MTLTPRHFLEEFSQVCFSLSSFLECSWVFSSSLESSRFFFSFLECSRVFSSLLESSNTVLSFLEFAKVFSEVLIVSRVFSSGLESSQVFSWFLEHFERPRSLAGLCFNDFGVPLAPLVCPG